MNTILTDDEIKKAIAPLYAGEEVLELALIVELDTARAIEAAVLAKLAQQTDRQRVPDGHVLVPVEPTQEMVRAVGMSPRVYARKVWAAMLAAAPEAPAQSDAAEAVNETNAILASRYFELLKVVENYEKSGVTCQTFRHFVDVPCAECNSAPEAPPQASAVELTVESIRAAGGIVHKDGNIFFTNIEQARAALVQKGGAA